jgi:hypothetical protein
VTLAAEGTAVREAFRATCLAAERPELRGTPTWDWIELLCDRHAAARADAFAAADRAGRLGLLAEECAAWFHASGWRWPGWSGQDAAARAPHVDAACAAEAEERLRELAPASR